MRWEEFGDSFEATIDNNLNLTGIEKINEYVNSKSIGETNSAVT